MIPASELAWSRVENPEEVVKPQSASASQGDEDRLRDPEDQPQPQGTGRQPWDTLTQRLHVGSRVQGKVTRTAEFGAFVEIEPGVEGLITTSPSWARDRVRRCATYCKKARKSKCRL